MFAPWQVAHARTRDAPAWRSSPLVESSQRRRQRAPLWTLAPCWRHLPLQEERAGGLLPAPRAARHSRARGPAAAAGAPFPGPAADRSRSGQPAGAPAACGPSRLLLRPRSRPRRPLEVFSWTARGLLASPVRRSRTHGMRRGGACSTVSTASGVPLWWTTCLVQPLCMVSTLATLHPSCTPATVRSMIPSDGLRKQRQCVEPRPAGSAKRLMGRTPPPVQLRA